jgi:hypothetical protein
MEVRSCSGNIEKFSERPRTKQLSKLWFVNWNLSMVLIITKRSHLNNLVHYEGLDVYEQHSSRILGVTQTPNLGYARASPLPHKLHYKLPLHIMGLCPTI